MSRQARPAAPARDREVGSTVTTAKEAGALAAAQAANQKPSEEEIRLRAYEKYCARHGVCRDEVKDWLEAERELCGEQREGDSGLTKREMAFLSATKAGANGDPVC
jgi:hypothetical protein